MTTTQTNIGNALLTAKEVLTQMIGQGFSDAKYVFALSNMLMEKYSLTQEQSTIIIENAYKLC